MPRSSHRRSSLSSGSEDESDTGRRHAPNRAPNRGRRAASMHLSTRPDIESHGSYHRASSERRHHSPEYSSSDSDSDDGYRRRRRRSRDDHSRSHHDQQSSRPSRQPSRASSRRSTPSPPRHRRHRSVDVHHDRGRGRDHSPSSNTTGHGGRPAMRRRPSSAEPAPSSSRSRRDKGYYPPSASHTPKGGPRHNTWPLPESMGDRLSHMHPPRPVGRHSDLLLSAGRTAFTAGAMAALKLKDDPTPWMGAKGAKVVAAGLSAACVDTFMESKHPKRKGGLAHTMLRQATNFAIGGLVVRPVEKGKVHIPQHMPTRRRSTRSGGGMEGGGRKSSGGSPSGGERRRR